jgi:hypothetical protein
MKLNYIWSLIINMRYKEKGKLNISKWYEFGKGK